MSDELKHDEKEAEGLISTKKACLNLADLPYSPLGSSEIRLVEILPGSFDDAIKVIITSTLR